MSNMDQLAVADYIGALVSAVYIVLSVSLLLFFHIRGIRAAHLLPKKTTMTKQFSEGDRKRQPTHSFEYESEFFDDCGFMYFSLITHFVDSALDLGVCVQYGVWAYGIQSGKFILNEGFIHIQAIFFIVLTILIFYRIASAAIIFTNTRKSCTETLLQLFDIELFYTIVLSHKNGRPTAIFDYIRRIHAVFEAGPMAVLQLIILTKLNLWSHPLNTISFAVSILNIVSRYVIDDAYLIIQRDCVWYATLTSFRTAEVISRVFMLAFVWVVFDGYVFGIVAGIEIIVVGIGVVRKKQIRLAESCWGVDVTDDSISWTIRYLESMVLWGFILSFAWIDIPCALCPPFKNRHGRLVDWSGVSMAVAGVLSCILSLALRGDVRGEMIRENRRSDMSLLDIVSVNNAEQLETLLLEGALPPSGVCLVHSNYTRTECREVLDRFGVGCTCFDTGGGGYVKMYDLPEESELSTAEYKFSVF